MAVPILDINITQSRFGALVSSRTPLNMRLPSGGTFLFRNEDIPTDLESLTSFKPITIGSTLTSDKINIATATFSQMLKKNFKVSATDLGALKRRSWTSFESRKETALDKAIKLSEKDEKIVIEQSDRDGTTSVSVYEEKLDSTDARDFSIGGKKVGKDAYFDYLKKGLKVEDKTKTEREVTKRELKAATIQGKKLEAIGIAKLDAKSVIDSLNEVEGISLNKTRIEMIEKIQESVSINSEDVGLMKEYVKALTPASLSLVDDFIRRTSRLTPISVRKEYLERKSRGFKRNLYPDLKLKTYADYGLETPTYEELGEVAPFGLNRTKAKARLEDDFVEPDFFLRRTNILRNSESKKVFNDSVEYVVNQILGSGDVTDPLSYPLSGFDKPVKSVSTNKPDVEVSKEGELSDFGIGLDSIKKYNNHAPLDIHTAATSIYENSNDNTWNMARAFPTFQIIFKHPEQKAFTGITYVDFYDVDTVSSIEVIKSRKHATDTAVITLVDLYEGLTDIGVFQILDEEGLVKIKKKEATGDKDKDFEDFILRPGIEIQIRMGYVNKSNTLPIVFNGIITEMTYEEKITIVAQGYGYELLKPKGYDKATRFQSKWHYDKNVVEELLKDSAEEILHFGRMGLLQRLRTNGGADVPDLILKRRKPSVWGKFFGGNLTTEELMENSQSSLVRGFMNYGGKAGLLIGAAGLLSLNPVATIGGFGSYASSRLALGVKNIGKQWRNTVQKLPFQEKREVTQKANLEFSIMKKVRDFYNKLTNNILDNNIFFDSYEGTFIEEMRDIRTKFYISRTTIWDIMKELECRHPGFATAVVPFDDRATLFFGRPEQLYWWTTGTALGNVIFDDYIITEAEAGKDVADKDPRLKPFTSYFFAHSSLNIVSNSITPSAEGTYTMTSVSEMKKSIPTKIIPSFNIDKEIDSLQRGRTHYAIANDNIPQYLLRYQHFDEINAASEFFAKRYAIGHLYQSMKEMYKGDITMLGDGNIKPYDVVYVWDDYHDIKGPIEVEQVVHHFSMETGFISIITPDLVVNVDNPNKMTTLFAWALLTKGADRDVYKKTYDEVGYSFRKYKDEDIKKLDARVSDSDEFVLLSKIGAVTQLGDITSYMPKFMGNIFKRTGGLAFFPVGTVYYSTTLQNQIVQNFRKKIQARNVISVYPLLFRGRPYVAGLDGFDKNGIIEFYKLKYKRGLQEFKIGAKSLFQTTLGPQDEVSNFGGNIGFKRGFGDKINFDDVPLDKTVQDSFLRSKGTISKADGVVSTRNNSFFKGVKTIFKKGSLRR